MKKTMCIDIGTVIGWCILDTDGTLQSGSLALATTAELEQQRREGRERTGDLRFERLFRFVDATVREGVESIVFEDVGFVKSRMQGQLWASLRSAIWAAATHHPGLTVHCVSSVTLKHFATGNGFATKEGMAKALAERVPELFQVDGSGSVRKPGGEIADHNEVDAAWLMYYALAVDKGERSFLGVYQRKNKQAEVRRERRAEQRLRAKARRALAEAKRKSQKQALRSLGRCCGAYRAQRNRWAVCLCCGSSQPLPHPKSTTTGSI
jgi:hypothetical protein